MKKLMILVCMCVAVSAFANERFYDETFVVDPGARFSLECHKGNINITTHNVSEIVVQARIYPDRGEDPELVDMLEINTHAGQRLVKIDVEYNHPEPAVHSFLGQSWTLPMIEWTIIVPEDASLELESHKATFDVDAPAGEVKIQSHKGQGSIRNVRGACEIETHKGDFKVEVRELEDLDFETHKGTIEATIFGAHDFSLEGDSHEGRLLFSGRDIPVMKDEYDDELRVDYQEGSRRNSIDVATHKGTIELHFVD